MKEPVAERSPSLGLFAGFGIELEYMIVESGALSVLPVTDELLKMIAGHFVNEVEVGELAWSNELALHVVELKTNGPAASLAGLAAFFQRDLARINGLLADLGGRLMPTAMHPWMDPHSETRLWPHEYSPIYEAFNRIFGCQGHGWSNLQSMHINLPFANDTEFARLHAAIRLILPILPALAASSPIMDRRVTGTMDNRLAVYRDNAKRVPSVSGHVIPEAVFTRRDYERRILDKIYRDLQPYDPEGTLRYEWVNARGAIARFDRNAIEIRVLDVQECPAADLALAALIVAVLRALTAEAWQDLKRQRRWEMATLAGIYSGAVRDAEMTVIDDRNYLEAFGYPERGRCRAHELWQHLIESLIFQGQSQTTEWNGALKNYLQHGSLARRIVTATQGSPSRERITEIYRSLCDCLATGTFFVP